MDSRPRNFGTSTRRTGPERPPASVKQIKVLPDKAPDCTSLRAIVDSVTRGCKTNDEKAIAIYNFMQLAHYHYKWRKNARKPEKTTF